MIIYAGDAHNVVARILDNHCSGNVEGSALRRRVAQGLGYSVRREGRPSGSARVRIDLPDPKIGERAVSGYIRSGTWQFVLCRDFDEAGDFEGFAIERLQPLLNVERPGWDRSKSPRYEELLALLLAMPPLSCDSIRSLSSGPGVYTLHHS